MNNKSNLFSKGILIFSIPFLSIALFVLVFKACTLGDKPIVIPEVTTTELMATPKVHVAFAGGGWRAHTGHSGWIISLLNKTRKLKDAFANVGTISSNSGGSWFSTMLMYSGKFVSEIQDANAHNNWGSSGWLGMQKYYFDQSGCTNTISDYLYQECVFDTYTGKDLDGGIYWKKVVDSLIFRDYPLDTLSLRGPRQSWATDKSLLLAGSLLTNAVVLNKDGSDHRYYQTCLAPASPVLSGDSGSSCSTGKPFDVSPVTFSSLPHGSGLTRPSFIAELGKPAHSGTLKVGYTEDFVFTTPPQDSAKIMLPLVNNTVPVMTAAAASSAALGFGASEGITDLFDLSYMLEDDAVSFELANNEVSYLEVPNSMSVSTLATNKVVRIADGGPVDNSGVIQLVRFLQNNYPLTDSLNIVAFDNVETAFTPGPKAATLGEDLSSLFGHRVSYCFTINIPIYGADTYCITAPSVKIFKSKAMTDTQVTWQSPIGADGTQVIYTKYTIETEENTVLGIKGKQSGTLHAFTCVNPNADIAPVQGDKDFSTYDKMLKYIYSEMSSGTGLKHLENAFGL